MEKGRLLGCPFFICPQVRLWPVGWRAPALARPGFGTSRLWLGHSLSPELLRGCCRGSSGLPFPACHRPVLGSVTAFRTGCPGRVPRCCPESRFRLFLSLPKASPLPHPGRWVPPAGRYRIRVPVSTPRRKVFPHRGTPPAGGGAGATACPCRCVRVRLP